METAWIIGMGRFGTIAANRLSKQYKDWRFVLVDRVKENLHKVKLPNSIVEHADGIRFLNDHLKPDTKVSWIIPSLPVHLAWEWCNVKMGFTGLNSPGSLFRVNLSPEIDSLLPNPMHGPAGDIYVSNADFICPPDCSEPEDFCTITKAPRKQDMYSLLETLKYKNYSPMVLRSRQLAPGVGGYSPGQLFDLLKKVEQYKGPLLLCTACRCHGVITGVDRF